MTKVTTRLSKVQVNIVDWQVVFVNGPVYFGCIRSDEYGVKFPFYSKEAGQQILFFIKLAMRRLEQEITEGEYELAMDYIKFSNLPKKSESDEFAQTLFDLKDVLPKYIYSALLKYV